MSSPTMAMGWTNISVDIVRSGRVLGVVSTFVLGGVLLIAGVSSNIPITIGFGVTFIILSVLGLIYIVSINDSNNDANLPLIGE
jgi:hypothetical protein